MFSDFFLCCAPGRQDSAYSSIDGRRHRAEESKGDIDGESLEEKETVSQTSFFLLVVTVSLNKKR